MSAQNALIAKYLRAIVKEDPELRSLLKTLRSRGILPGVSTTCIAGEDATVPDCCDPGDEDPYEDPEDPEDPDEPGGGGGIDGERPDDGETEKGMDGSYRLPDGETYQWDEQPCTPDESWAAGTYWASSFNSTHHAATAVSAINSAFAEAEALSTECVYMSDIVRITNDSYESILKKCTTGEDLAPLSATRLSCLGVDAAYCKLTRAPCKEDNEWPPDGKCQEALINGMFIPHPKDPDCAGRPPRDIQTMCHDGRCITYIPTSDGGHMRVTLDPTTRLPTKDSTVTYYGPDGKANREEGYRKRNVELNAYSENNVPGNWE